MAYAVQIVIMKDENLPVAGKLQVQLDAIAMGDSLAESGKGIFRRIRREGMQAAMGEMPARIGSQVLGVGRGDGKEIEHPQNQYSHENI